MLSIAGVIGACGAHFCPEALSVDVYGGPKCRASAGGELIGDDEMDLLGSEVLHTSWPRA